MFVGPDALQCCAYKQNIPPSFPRRAVEKPVVQRDRFQAIGFSGVTLPAPVISVPAPRSGRERHCRRANPSSGRSASRTR